MKISKADFKALRERITVLDTKRTRWDSVWRDVQEFIDPHSGIGLPGAIGSDLTYEVDDGDEKFGKIYDSAPVLAANIFAGGMYSGMANPMYPWFRLHVLGMTREEMDATEIKRYLDDATEELRLGLAEFGVNDAFQHAFHEIGVYGQACIGMYADDAEGLLVAPYTAGEYWFGLGKHGRIDTVVIKRPYTVQQVVSEYGLENVCASTRQLYERNQVDERVEVIIICEPNDDRLSDGFKPAELYDGQTRPWQWRVITFEKQAKDDEVLRINGARRFPFLTPRWDPISSAAYSRSPGWSCLNDSRMLQTLSKQMMTAIGKQVDPPLIGDVSISQDELNTLPGGYNQANGMLGSAAPLRSLYDVRVDWQAAELVARKIEANIRNAFHTDLFLMISQSTGPNQRRTAEEVIGMQREKIQVLGPSLERTQRELLNPALDLVWDALEAQGRMPPLPPQLQGRTVKFLYTSALAQALQLGRLQGLNNLVGWVGQVAPMKPEVMDKVNWSETVDYVADVSGVPARLLATDDEFVQIVQARAQDQQKQVEAERQKLAADTALALSRANVGQQNALTATMAAQGVG